MSFDDRQTLPKDIKNPCRIPWQGWFSIFKRTLFGLSGSDISLRCAGVAFFGFLSIFPAMACLVLVYGLAASADDLERQLAQLAPFMPESAFTLIQQQLLVLLAQPQSGLGIGLAISFAVMLWSGSRGINALLLALNTSHHSANKRKLITNIAISLLLTLGSLAFLILALFMIAAIPVLLSILPFSTVIGNITHWLRWPLVMSAVLASVVVLYLIAPNGARSDLPWVLPGAVLATVLWGILSVLLSLYVENFASYNATFGSLSLTVVMMLWLYYSTAAIIIGAHFNAEMEFQAGVECGVLR